MRAEATNLQRFLTPGARRALAALFSHIQAQVNTWVLLAIIGLGLALRAVIGPLFIDDAYITFRYAQNLAAGAGFVYNQGERVLGTSTPLFTALLALSSRLGLGVENGAFCLSLLADSVAIWLLWQLCGRLGMGSSRGFLAFLYAIAPFAVLASLSGMETSLYTCTLLLCFWLCMRERWVLAGTAAALAALLRPEGVLALAAVCLAFAILKRRIPFRIALVGGAVLASWYGFAWLYYGSPVPNSAIAKAIVFPADPFPLRTLLDLGNQIANPFQTVPLGAPVYLALALLGAWVAVKREPALWAVAFWVTLDVLFFAAPNRYLFPWYAIPLVPFALSLATLGLGTIFSFLRQLVKAQFSGYAINGIVAVSAAVFIGLALLATPAKVQAERFEFAHRENVYACLGRQLYARWPQTGLASVEIGALGYSYPGRIIDLAGLVTPSVLPYYSAPDYQFSFPFKVSARLVREQRPPILVAFDSMLPFRNESWFVSEYHEEINYARLHSYYGSLMVFLRRDIPKGTVGDLAQEVQCR